MPWRGGNLSGRWRGLAARGMSGESVTSLQLNTIEHSPPLSGLGPVQSLQQRVKFAGNGHGWAAALRLRPTR
jgi:hypothetical protein